jgi:hypothetical protein
MHSTKLIITLITLLGDSIHSAPIPAMTFESQQVAPQPTTMSINIPNAFPDSDIQQLSKLPAPQEAQKVTYPMPGQNTVTTPDSTIHQLSKLPVDEKETKLHYAPHNVVAPDSSIFKIVYPPKLRAILDALKEADGDELTRDKEEIAQGSSKHVLYYELNGITRTMLVEMDDGVASLTVGGKLRASTDKLNGAEDFFVAIAEDLRSRNLNPHF